MARRLTEARVTALLDEDDATGSFAVVKFVAQRGDAWWNPTTGSLEWPSCKDDVKFSVVYERLAGGRVTVRANPL